MQKSIILIFALCLAIASCIKFKPVEKAVGSEINHAEDFSSYWTEERMAAAIPMDMTHPGDFNITEAKSAIDPEEVPSYSNAGMPAMKFSNYTDVNDPLYPFPFTAGFAPSYTAYPWSAVGKVFFTQGGVNYVCSGATVNTYIIYTAGHCVYSASAGWSYNFVFVPGYNNNNRPFGNFNYYQLWTTSGWYNSASFCYDVGIAILQKRSGYGVGNYVGWFGAMWNAAYNLAWRSLGYPQAAPFNGQLNYYADSALGVKDTFCTPNTMGIGSAATGGCSGGPWVYGFGGSNYINSVNSYKYSNQPNAIYGPYFGAAAQNLFNTAVAITPP